MGQPKDPGDVCCQDHDHECHGTSATSPACITCKQLKSLVFGWLACLKRLEQLRQAPRGAFAQYLGPVGMKINQALLAQEMKLMIISNHRIVDVKFIEDILEHL